MASNSLLGLMAGECPGACRCASRPWTSYRSAVGTPDLHKESLGGQQSRLSLQLSARSSARVASPRFVDTRVPTLTTGSYYCPEPLETPFPNPNPITKPSSLDGYPVFFPLHRNILSIPWQRCGPSCHNRNNLSLFTRNQVVFFGIAAFGCGWYTKGGSVYPGMDYT